MKQPYEVATWDSRFDLYPEANSILCSAWPEFMLHNKKVDPYWNTFVQEFKDIQLMLLNEGEILAIVNTQTIHIGTPLEELPDEGWEWGFLKAIEDKRTGLEANYLLGFQVVIHPRHQGKGLAQAAVTEMKNLSCRLGLKGVLIALRPNHKETYPLLSMDDYLKCRLSSGEAFDPWLRIHERLGAEVIRVCPRAYTIRGSVKEWEDWTGQIFPCSGDYLIDGGLNPMELCIEDNVGTYTEPNLWVVHRNHLEFSTTPTARTHSSEPGHRNR